MCPGGIEHIFMLKLFVTLPVRVSYCQTLMRRARGHPGGLGAAVGQALVGEQLWLRVLGRSVDSRVWGRGLVRHNTVAYEVEEQFT